MEYLTRKAADIVCLSEGPGKIGFKRTAAWEGQAPEHVAALAYDLKTPEEVRPAIREALAKGIGYLYLTDASNPNPWGRLPRW